MRVRIHGGTGIRPVCEQPNSPQSHRERRGCTEVGKGSSPIAHSLFPIAFSVLIATILLALCVWATPAHSDVLLDQPVDYNSFFESRNWGGARIQVGDDLIVTHGRAMLIDKVSFVMAITWPDTLDGFAFEVYRTVTDSFWPWGWRPLYTEDYRYIGATEVIDRGEWTGGGRNQFGHTLHEVEVAFDNLNLLLERGVSLDDRWFFSPMGLTPDPRQTTSYWVTSGDGDLNGSEGWVKTHPFSGVGWQPIGTVTGMYPTDFAMRIEGQIIPGPGVVGVLIVGLGVVGRPRRRR